MISTSEIEYVLALEAHRSFTSAAQALGISQPALTVAIGKLEKKLGFLLFRRTGSGVELTSAGEALLPDVRRARDAVRVVEYAAEQVADARLGALRIACRPTLAREPVARLVGGFFGEYGALELEIANIGWHSSAYRMLRAGLGDVAITTADDDLDGLEVESLGDLPLVAVVPPDAELGDEPSLEEVIELGLLSMSGYGVISRAVDVAIGSHRVAEATILQSDYQALLTELARQGRGVVFVPEATGLTYQRLGARVVVTARQPVVQVVAGHLAGHRPPAIERFLDHAHRHFAVPR
ncbi:LysR family transcriptional regulator [Epidermidibacterium keratini]|uniref:LysR family transcriptional regulator n=1 Tax=Epidermidibacterium keratini TaxID=1891644 RepID=A0A7L4YN62_9ACTN|nr:LysR family transcriptional regulator [Epidermidibacterium keratini]QHC00576.1 LysR family transcriptional regulator [Epidermidibacterium keratini]